MGPLYSLFLLTVGGGIYDSWLRTPSRVHIYSYAPPLLRKGSLVFSIYS